MKDAKRFSSFVSDPNSYCFDCVNLFVYSSVILLISICGSKNGCVLR